MATTINDTLFNDWAEAFARDIYINTPDEVVKQLFGSNPLGLLGNRQEIDYVVNIDFGKSINRDVKISELTMLLQMLNAREDADVMPIIVEVLKLILGDAFDIGTIFGGVLGDGGDASSNLAMAGEENTPLGGSADEAAEQAQRGIISLGTGAGNISDASNNQSAAAQNQI